MGQISRIQLRGISRNPSDRLNEDGGCAESLNVYLDQDESAPALKPIDVTEELGLPDDLQAEKVFIHKTASYRNVLAYASGKVVACIGGKAEDVLDMGEAQDVTFAGVGNTVLVSSANGVHYLLYNEGAYKILGTKIPFPAVKFVAKYCDEVSLYERRQTSYSIEGGTTVGDEGNVWLSHGEYTQKIWNKLNAETEDDPEKYEGTQKVNEVCKELVQAVRKEADENEIFVDHVFVRYAVTLYDDTVISSVPYLMAGGYEEPFFIRYKKDAYKRYMTLGDGQYAPEVEVYKDANDESVICKANYPYRIHATMLDDPSVFDDWKDLIKSIDIYISEKQFVQYDKIFATSCDMQGTGEYEPYYNEGIGEPEVSQGMTYYERLKETRTNLFLSVGGPEYRSEFVYRLLDNSLFHKLESIVCQGEGSAGYAAFKKRISELHEGTQIDASAYFKDYDAFVAGKDLLAGDDMLHSEIAWKDAVAFNNSLFASGASEILGTGSLVNPCAALDIAAMSEVAKTATLDKMFSSLVPEIVPPDDYALTESLSFTYIIEEDGMEKVVYGRDYEGGRAFHDEAHSFYGWIVFPHRKCKKVIVQRGDYAVAITMRPHPMLDCSYAYFGLGLNISTLLDMNGDAMDIPAEDRRLARDNKLYRTKMDNPFYYEKEGIYTFQSKVIGVAVATTALSQGQFGQFPLYVFTEDGIWAMETAADGSFVTSKPLSRDVCINADSITSIDSAVVFVSDKGVMLLQGSQTVNLSPHMTGRHYRLEDSAKVIMQGVSGFPSLLPVVRNDTHFQAFVRNASVAYDYSGKRLVFINPSEDYQYIYMLETQTWHKTAYGIKATVPLNSYPEALVQCKGEMYGLTLYVEDAYRYDDQTFDLFLGETQGLVPLTEAELRDMFFNGTNYDVVVDEAGKKAIEEASRMADIHAKVTLSYEEDTVHVTRIYDFSTILDRQETMTPTKGIIVTRALDLGEPDVLKTITDVRIRGDFRKGAVKFILMGSQDGIAYHPLSTLRGRAWKHFRIILLADLQPNERISWIDVMYETRFTNKLR